MEERLSVAEAAARLDLSTEALRQRIRRGTVRSEKIKGRLYVVVPASEPVRTEARSASEPIETAGATDTRALVEQLQRENERLWNELAKRDEEIHRRDVLLRDALDWRSALGTGATTSSPIFTTAATATERVETRQTPSPKRRWWTWFTGRQSA